MKTRSILSLAAGIFAGLLLSFTLASCGDDDDDKGNGYHYSDNPGNAVDMGLSVKWADCNVGAASPEDYGYYYAWGETVSKSTYTWENYQWYDPTAHEFTKYIPEGVQPMSDNKTELDLEDDAAHAAWGGSWRMPTLEEMDELCDNCTFTWTTQNGIEGCIATSKITGNSIFLPATGFHSEKERKYVNTVGVYWCASLYDEGCGYRLVVEPVGVPDVAEYRLGMSAWLRVYGHSVRPVCP